MAALVTAVTQVDTLAMVETLAHVETLVQVVLELGQAIQQWGSLQQQSLRLR